MMINWMPNFFLPPGIESSLRGKDPALAFSGNGGRFFLTVTPTGKPDDFEAVLWNLVGEGRNKKYLVAAQTSGPFSRKGGFPEIRFVAAWADKEAKKRKLESKMTETPNAEKMINERMASTPLKEVSNEARMLTNSIIDRYGKAFIKYLERATGRKYMLGRDGLNFYERNPPEYGGGVVFSISITGIKPDPMKMDDHPLVRPDLFFVDAMVSVSTLKPEMDMLRQDAVRGGQLFSMLDPKKVFYDAGRQSKRYYESL